MARSRYRSQPALQRSGGRGGVTLLGFGLAILAAAGGGVLLSTVMRGLDDWANTPRPKVEQVARNASAASPPTAASSLEAQSAGGPEPEVGLAHAATTPRSMTRRAPKAVKPVKPLLAEFGAPQRRWEQQQQAYQLARSAYDASERAEGFRWAQQYKVRGRYCRELGEQRTAAFMEGCLNYAAGARPRQPAGAGQENPG